MAAEGRIMPGDNLHSNHYSPKPGEQLTYVSYLKGLNVNDVLNRAVPVVGGASGGLSIGGLIGGATAGPPGAVTGMAIGGAIGFVSGIVCNTGSDYMHYKNYRNALKAEARKKLDEIVNDAIGLDYVCAISGQFPRVPVRVRGEPQVYENAILQEWCAKKGTSPLTVQKFKKEDIVLAEDALANAVKVADAILNNPKARAKYSDDFLQGFAALRDDTLKFSNECYTAQATILLETVKERKISPKDFRKESARLADFYDQLLGDPVYSHPGALEQDEKADG